MEYLQLSFLPTVEGDENNGKIEDNKQKNLKEKNQFISERLKNEFDIMALPFWGCNFDSIYPKIGRNNT